MRKGEEGENKLKLRQQAGEKQQLGLSLAQKCGKVKLRGLILSFYRMMIFAKNKP